MRIPGEIFNSRSAAADLTQSRSTRSATRRLDTKAGDSYCSLSPAHPFVVCRQGLTLSAYRGLRFFQLAAIVPIGRHIFKYRPLVLTSGAMGIRDADRDARRASSSKSTLPQMAWSKENRLDLAQIGKMFES